MKKYWLMAAAVILSGCMSTKIILNSKWDPRSKPSYNDYVDSYFFGFAGVGTINISRVCMDQKPYGLRRVKTFEDGFISLVTLGIYTPSTIKIWCGE